MEMLKITSAEDLRRILGESGSNLKGTTFEETTARIGQNDLPVVKVEKADGETFFQLLDTSGR